MDHHIRRLHGDRPPVRVSELRGDGTGGVEIHLERHTRRPPQLLVRLGAPLPIHRLAGETLPSRRRTGRPEPALAYSRVHTCPRSPYRALHAFPPCRRRRRETVPANVDHAHEERALFPLPDVRIPPRNELQHRLLQASPGEGAADVAARGQARRSPAPDAEEPDPPPFPLQHAQRNLIAHAQERGGGG